MSLEFEISSTFFLLKVLHFFDKEVYVLFYIAL